VFLYDWQRDVDVTVKKLRKPAIVYKNGECLQNSSIGTFELAGCTIVSLASVGDKTL